MKTQTIEIASLYARGLVNSVNEKNRTVDLIFSTGAPVDRADGYGRYREVLSMDPKHVRLERLNSGAPLLNSHSAYSISDVIGTVEPGTARMVDGQGLATVRFSRRDDVEAIWQDVIDGIIRSVSVGYRVHKFQEDASKPGTIATRTAIDWEPFELSMVSMPADPGAKVRAGAEVNICRIVSRDAVEHDDDGSYRPDWDRVPSICSARAGELRSLMSECIQRNVPYPVAEGFEFAAIVIKHEVNL